MNQYLELIKAIDNGNIILARSIIIGYANQSIEKVLGALEIINSSTLSIFEPSDELLYPINTDQASWNDDYWHGLTSDLMHNFSEIRLNHLLEVSKFIRATPETIVTRDIGLENTIKKKLDVLVNEGNLSRLRSELIGMLNVEVHNALKAFIYTVEQKPEILQYHDEELYPINDENSSWDSSYWHGLTSDLMHNFSKERFEHMLLVRQYLDNKDNHEASSQGEKFRSHEFNDRSTENIDEPVNTFTYILIAAGIVLAIPLALWLMFKR